MCCMCVHSAMQELTLCSFPDFSSNLHGIVPKCSKMKEGGHLDATFQSCREGSTVHILSTLGWSKPHPPPSTHHPQPSALIPAQPHIRHSRRENHVHVRLLLLLHSLLLIINQEHLGGRCRCEKPPKIIASRANSGWNKQWLRERGGQT